jgi:hypothetical protein
MSEDEGMNEMNRWQPNRRTFLAGMALAGGTLGCGVMGAADALAGPVDATEKAVKPDKAGYRETDHIRRYYDKARL